MCCVLFLGQMTSCFKSCVFPRQVERLCSARKSCNVSRTRRIYQMPAEDCSLVSLVPALVVFNCSPQQAELEGSIRLFGAGSLSLLRSMCSSFVTLLRSSAHEFRHASKPLVPNPLTLRGWFFMEWAGWTVRHGAVVCKPKIPSKDVRLPFVHQHDIHALAKAFAKTATSKQAAARRLPKPNGSMRASATWLAPYAVVWPSSN